MSEQVLGQKPVVETEFSSWIRKLRTGFFIQRPRKETENTLADQLESRLATLPIPKYSSREGSGLPAFLLNNEEAPDGFFDQLRSQNPDGYIVGVGSGGVLSMIQGFSGDNKPKGIILADLNPHVVAPARLLIQSLGEFQTQSEFVDRYLNLSRQEYAKRLKKVTQSDSKLRASEANSEIPLIRSPKQAWDIVSGKSMDTVKKIDTVQVVLDNYPTLHQLALEGKIAVCFVDFTDPTFIKAVTELPGFRDSRNVVYMSNMVDILTSFGRKYDSVTRLEMLRAYEDSQKNPVFVDCPGMHGMVLRINNHLPQYSKDDV